MNDRPLLTIAIPTYNRAGFLRQLLDSVIGQVKNEGRVELLISDNASTDETANLVSALDLDSVRMTVIRNDENIGPDANFLQCYEHASGKYVWIMGDDDLLVPGAVNTVLDFISRDEYELIYASQAGFQGSAAQQIRNKAHKSALTFTDAASFLRRVHVFTTLISCNIINKDRVDSIEHKPFSELVNSNLIQLGWTFTALRAHRRSLYIRDPLVLYRVANTGGYGVCRVFGETLAQITEEWLSIPKLNQVIVNASLQRFLPYCLLIANRNSKGDFHEEDAHAVLSRVFHNNFRYWFFDYPLIVLPARLAWVWMQVVRVINLVDRACGLPLIG
jgi:abequosyltransferase